MSLSAYPRTDHERAGRYIEGVSDQPANPPELSNPYPSAVWESPDSVLIGLVNAVNAIDFEIGLRINVAGHIISGVLIPGSRFFDLMAESLLEDDDDESRFIRTALSELYADTATTYRAWANEAREKTENTSRPVAYIHLKESWAHNPGGQPLALGLWRGRLGQVSGWSMGNYDNPID